MNNPIGKIVVIKRNGADGPQFPLRTNECLFGRKPKCDIRIQLPNVSQEHAVVRVDNDKKIKLINLSTCNQTLVNGQAISQVEVQHLDVFTISDRSFRFEFPSPVQKQAKEKSPKTHRRRSSTLGSTPQENKTPKMPTPKGSPRTPPTGGSLKENIHRLRRHSMPLQEEEEALASPAANKTPFSMIAVNSEPELVSEKVKSVGRERKTQRRSKRVSFGPVLSPEQFDKNLPPATPVRRGATPRRSSNSSDHSLIPLSSSAKKRRSVIASPHTESIEEEEDYCQNASENNASRTQMQFPSKPESSEQYRLNHLVDTHELISPLLEDNALENIVQKSATPEKCTESPKRMERKIAETIAMEVDVKETPKGRSRLSSSKATPKSATPKANRRSFSGLDEKNFESIKKDEVSQKSATPKECGQPSSSLEEENATATGTNQVVLENDTPQRNRRSSMRLAAKSPSLLEFHSVDEVQSKVTAPRVGHCVEENMDETILDSDDYTSDEEEADGKRAIVKAKSTRLETPLRKEIEEGIKLKTTKKKMVTPLKTEIANGIRLRQTKRRMATPLKKEITEGATLRETKKKLKTPLRKAIEDGVTLRVTKKKLSTPLKKAIQAKPQLRQTKKIMNSMLQNEIKGGLKLRKTKQTLPLEVQIEIIKGKQLRPSKMKLPTPLRKAISGDVTLRKTKKSLPTPLKEEIKRGVQLQKTKKSLPTPVRRQLEEGVALKQTVKSRKRKRSEAGVNDKEPKRPKTSPSKGVTEADEEANVAPVRRALKTPLRKAIVAGTRLRATRHRMVTPLRKQIHSKHVLRAVRRKSAVIAVPEKTVPRKPTYAEIVKRPKKRISQGSSFKFGKTAKVFSKAIPPAKITDAALTNPEIPRTHVNAVQSKDRRNSARLARMNTPQKKSTKSTNSQGTPTFSVANEATKKSWMSTLARATNGLKTRATSVEDLEGLSEMFATPPAVQINSNSLPKQQKSNSWLSSLAKATNGPRKRGMPVEDLDGVAEMFATPTASPGNQALQMTEPLKSTRTPSLRSSAKDTEILEIVTPIQSSCTPSLRSGRKPAAKTAVTPQAMLETEEVLKPKMTPSLRNSAEDAITVKVVTPVQPSRTPSLRSAKTQSCVLTSECSDHDLEFVQPIAPSKTPSIRSSPQRKVVLQNSVGNPSVHRKSLGLQGLTRLMKSPKEKNAVENAEDFFVPNLFASPKPQPKRYSRKSEGLQGVARLLRTPEAKDEVAGESPKLDGIKTMMQAERTLASPNFVGLRMLMKTPKTYEKRVDTEEYFSSELFASPVDDLPQGTEKSTVRYRKDKKLSSTSIDLTSPQTEETTAKQGKNIDSSALPRTTRAKRKTPEDSMEPVPKRGRRTRTTVEQKNESKIETHLRPIAARRKSSTKSKKTTAAAIQRTPKPFLFKRTQLDPIIEIPSPLPSFDEPDVTEKASTEETETRNATETKRQSKAPLRSSRRGNRAKAKAETSLEESCREEVAEKRIATRSKKNEGVKEGTKKAGDTQKAAVEITELKADGKRVTRSTKAKVSDEAPPKKTKATRSRRADVQDEVVEVTITDQTTRRSRRAAKTIEESVQVLGETKSARSTSREETRDSIVPEMRCSRSSRKPAHDRKVVEKDDLARSTQRKNSKKDEVEQLEKDVKPKEIEEKGEPRSTRRTRGNSAEKGCPEGDGALLQEKKQVRTNSSAKKSLPKRELKGKAPTGPRETRSTRSAKLVEDDVEFSEQSVRSTRGTKRSRQDAEPVTPKSKRTRSSVQTQSVNTRQTRSRSRK